MKIRFLAAAIITILLANFGGFASPDTRRQKVKKRQADRLVSLLPASDGVAVFESKRFLDDALPQILTANQPMLSEITTKLNEMQNRTGIDLHKFQRVAVGVAYKQISAKETDYEPVIIATAPEINYDALVAAAKAASNGTFRTEMVGDKSIFIFTVKPNDLLKKPAANNTNSGVTDAFDRALKGLTKEIALTAIDRNTIAIGTVNRVKDTLVGRSHLSPELTGLLVQGSVMTFALRPPGGMANLIPLDQDNLGKTLESIQFFAGSLDVSPTGTGLHLLARSKTAEQALGLKDLLEVGQSFGKIAFAGKKRPDQQVYARMINAAKLGIKGTDVTVDVVVPQADIDILIAGVK
jgi:hypothetical protein